MAVNSKSFIKSRRSLKAVAVLYLLVTILLCSIVLVNLYTGIPLEIFTKDLATVADVNPFVGVVSSVGVLFWCIGASICLFTFSNIVRQGNKINDYTFFLLFFGLTTFILLFDDLFLFHEFVAPIILNISQKLIYLFYGILVLFGIVRFRKIIFQTEWIILCLAFVFFALSITIDLFDSLLVLPSSVFFEDSFKLFGIVSWVCYLVLASSQIQKNALDSKNIYRF